LPDQDVAGNHAFAAVTFHAASLRVRIAAVAAGTLTFFMCHGKTLGWTRPTAMARGGGVLTVWEGDWRTAQKRRSGRIPQSLERLPKRPVVRNPLFDAVQGRSPLGDTEAYFPLVFLIFVAGTPEIELQHL